MKSCLNSSIASNVPTDNLKLKLSIKMVFRINIKLLLLDYMSSFSFYVYNFWLCCPWDNVRVYVYTLLLLFCLRMSVYVFWGAYQDDGRNNGARTKLSRKYARGTHVEILWYI